jgi:hypothetical protein
LGTISRGGGERLGRQGQSIEAAVHELRVQTDARNGIVGCFGRSDRSAQQRQHQFSRAARLDHKRAWDKNLGKSPVLWCPWVYTTPIRLIPTATAMIERIYGHFHSQSY